MSTIGAVSPVPLPLLRAAVPSHSAAADGYAGSVEVRPGTPFVRRDGPAIPDVRGMLARGLRFEALNQGITTCYTHFAPIFNRIIDPDNAPSTPPNWFAIASYASRGAGRGEIGARQALAVLDAHPAMSTAAALQKAWPDLADDDARMLEDKIRDNLADCPTRPGSMREQRTLAAFLVACNLATVRSAEGRFLLDHLAMLDPRMLTVSVKRLSDIVAQAPGETMRDRLTCVMSTIRNGLEDGNRSIVSDIGVAGQRYLEFRQGRRTVTPDQVLDGFVLGTSDAKQARALFDFARHASEGHDPLEGDLEARFPAPAWDSNSMMVAGFALYEQAGRVSDPRVKGRLVASANNFLAYREQHDAAQGAFTPGRILADECDRPPVWELLTPMVDIEARYGTWSFPSYASAHLPPRDHNPLTPRATEYNWGTFRDRWFAILDAFDETYANAAAMWPMPNPDPARGIDEPAR